MCIIKALELVFLFTNFPLIYLMLQIIMDNGPARKLNTAQKVQAAGDTMGDPFEISNIRREVRNGVRLVRQFRPQHVFCQKDLLSFPVFESC